MNDLNLGPRGKHRKCAKICGDTSGNYHPHGESVVYPTLVGMAQPFTTRYPLVDSQGNFGAIDGSPPAAMRYTEARMGHPAVAPARGPRQGDGRSRRELRRHSRMQPVVLPGRFPNLICNGSTGIAVGMATSLAPHNLKEVAAALDRLLRQAGRHARRVADASCRGRTSRPAARSWAARASATPTPAAAARSPAVRSTTSRRRRAASSSCSPRCRSRSRRRRSSSASSTW